MPRASTVSSRGSATRTYARRRISPGATGWSRARSSVTRRRGRRRRDPRRAGSSSSRRTPCTGSPARRIARSRSERSRSSSAVAASSRSRSSRPSSTGCSSASRSSRGGGGACPQRSCPARTRSSSRTRRGRFPWLSGERPTRSASACPKLAGPGAELLEEVGAVAATSANLHGGRRSAAPSRTSRRRSATAAAAVLDGGELPGTPSTVLDLTGPEPRVLREGAVPGGRGASPLGSE